MLIFSPKEVYPLVALYSIPPFPPATKHNLARILFQKCSDTNSFTSCKQLVEKLIQLNIFVSRDAKEINRDGKERFDFDREALEVVWKKTPYFRFSLEVMIDNIDDQGILIWDRDKIRRILFRGVNGVYT